MIIFAENQNLDKLKEKLVEFECEHQYNISVLPHNKKSYCMEFALSDLKYPQPYWNVHDFVQFLHFNGISGRILAGNKFLTLNKDVDTIYIGVREDVVKHIDFSFALVITAINVMEERIRFKSKEIHTAISKPEIFP